VVHLGRKGIMPELSYLDEALTIVLAICDAYATGIELGFYEALRLEYENLELTHQNTWLYRNEKLNRAIAKLQSEDFDDSALDAELAQRNADIKEQDAQIARLAAQVAQLTERNAQLEAQRSADEAQIGDNMGIDYEGQAQVQSEITRGIIRTLTPNATTYTTAQIAQAIGQPERMVAQVVGDGGATEAQLIAIAQRYGIDAQRVRAGLAQLSADETQVPETYRATYDYIAQHPQCTYAQIAQACGISTSTVRNHLRAIADKVRVNEDTKPYTVEVK